MNQTISATGSRVNWAELGRCEHLVQFYPSDDVFLDTLEGFVAGGVEKGEVTVLIATPDHLAALNQRLISRGFNPDHLRARQRYVTLDAEESLQRFMIGDLPDEALFRQFVHGLLARSGGKRVRAFGEMVVLLWQRGQSAAMLRLEQLWHSLCQEEEFALLCAYPRNAFTHYTEKSMWEVCDAHSRVIS